MTSSFERGLNAKKASQLSEYIEEPERSDSGLCLSALVFPSCVLRREDFLWACAHTHYANVLISLSVCLPPHLRLDSQISMQFGWVFSNLTKQLFRVSYYTQRINSILLFSAYCIISANERCNFNSTCSIRMQIVKKSHFPVNMYVLSVSFYITCRCTSSKWHRYSPDLPAGYQ